jgi:TDG/mug DNA glycosylase family protein
MTKTLRRPSRAELKAAAGRTIQDVTAPGLRVLFCGINPGLYSGATGHHFAYPGNRFWNALFDAGFTPRALEPREEHELLRYGCGITNLVGRATATAAELSPAEIRDGGAALRRKVRDLQPQVVAVLGIGAYRIAFGRTRATTGLQPQALAGQPLWVLPNPSGLNAHYQRQDLAVLFGELAAFAASPQPPRHARTGSRESSPGAGS